MFVTPPPNSAAAAAAAAALQLQAAAATSGGMQARYGQIYSLGVAAPLLPAPPPTTPLQAAHHHAAAIMAAVSPASGGAAAPTAAPSAVQAPPPQQPPPTPPPVAAAAGVGPQQQPVAAAAISSAAHKYLMSAYRVAMLALENLGRRIAEDRPQAKYAKTPSYAEDVKWLHSVAQKLGKDNVSCRFSWRLTCVVPGLAYVEKFFLFAMRSIQSPFVLQVSSLLIFKIRHITTCNNAFIECLEPHVSLSTPLLTGAGLGVRRIPGVCDHRVAALKRAVQHCRASHQDAALPV